MNIKVSAEFFLNTVNGMNKYKPFGYFGSDDFIISYSDIKPIEGYEAPINIKTGKKLPYCCDYHLKMFNKLRSWYDKKFPNCCDIHKGLAANPLFDKKDYKNVAEKVVKQLSYTEHLIINHIDHTDWFEDITQYIEYNSFSFGGPVQVGFGEYLNYLYSMLSDVTFFKGMTESKRTSLTNFVKAYFEPSEKIDSTDLNLLYSTYQKWLNTFPFDLSFFSHLKPYFENQFPILIGKVEKNRYLGSAKSKVQSKQSLMIYLESVTNSIIKQINSYSLYKKGLLTEPDKIKLELIVSERNIKLQRGYLSEISDETKFETILDNWFTDEKKFIDEVSPLLKTLPPQPLILDTSITEKLSAKHYALSFIFDCNADDMILPLGNKKELEKIGTGKMGVGRGNTFYKSYNLIVHKNLDIEGNLIEIAGENWRKIILKLSSNNEKLEHYLQSKNL